MEAKTEFQKKLLHALLEASNKILGGKPKAEQKKAAVYFKLQALQVLDRIGDAAATEQLDAYPAEVAKMGLDDKDLVRGVRGCQLASRLQARREGRTQGSRQKRWPR